MGTFILLSLLACNLDPGHPEEGVDYRTGLDGGPVSGERGNLKITEILWSGSVRLDPESGERTYDPSDVFLELSNQGARPVDVTGWRLDLSGAHTETWRIPAGGPTLEVGQRAYIAKKSSGCFPEPDWVIPTLAFPNGDPIRVTLKDFDERLMEPAGDREMPPFAGGYDLVTSRSMERVNLMFGGRGNEPQSWHYYNGRSCGIGEGLNCYEAVPNNDRMDPDCRRHTGASPGRSNSLDYSGAYANGGLD